MPESDQQCLSTNTADGKPCENLKHSCPHEAHRQPNRVAPRAVVPSHSGIDTDQLLQAARKVGPQYQPRVADLSNFLDSGTAVGLPTDPVGFAEIIAVLWQRHPTLELDMLVRDTHLINALWCLAERYPHGRVLIEPTPRPRKQLSPHEVGTYLFVGGTALVTGHRIGERISDDLDVLFIPHPDHMGNSTVGKNCRRIGKAAAPGIGDRYAFGTFGKFTARCEYPLAGDEEFIKMDVVPKRDFREHLDLIGVETHQVVSLAGRYATAEQLARYPQLGGFEMQLVHPAYTAATKFDALHHRAERGTERALLQLADRARDLYDLYSIANSDRAAEVRERVPALAEVTIHDFMNRGDHPRPTGGYANSPVFKDGTPADEALRRGVAEHIPRIVWGTNRPTRRCGKPPAASTSRAVER